MTTKRITRRRALAGLGGFAIIGVAKAETSLNARDFGAVGDGRRDDTGAIQGALDAAAAAPRAQAVFLPAGAWRISAPLFIDHGVRLIGEGASRQTARAKGTQLVVSHERDGAVQLVGHWAGVERLGIRQKGRAKNGAAVEIGDVEQATVRDLYIQGGHRGVAARNSNTAHVRNILCRDATGPEAFLAYGAESGRKADALTFVDVASSAKDNDDMTHFHIRGNVDGVKVLRGRFVRGGRHGLRCSAEGAKAPSYVWITDGGVDHVHGDAMRFDAGLDVFMANLWIGQAGGDGVSFGPDFFGAVNASNIRIRGGMKNGMRVSGGRAMHFQNLAIGQNSRSARGRFAGLVIDGGDGITVNGGTLGALPRGEAGGANEQGYGLRVGRHAANVAVTGVNMRGNLHGAHDIDPDAENIRLANILE